MRFPRTLLALLLLAAAAFVAAEEAPLDAMAAQRLRERLAAGRVGEAQRVVAEMRAAPHSRHGLLLFEAIVRADRRVALAARELAALEPEREEVAKQLADARATSSTSVRKRLEEKREKLDGEIAEQAATQQREGQLRAVCRDGYDVLAARLLQDAADELAKQLVARLEQEREQDAATLLAELLGPVGSGRAMVALMGLLRERATPTELRVAAVVALGRRGEAAATPAVLPLLDDGDWRVQAEAIEALRRFHQPSTIPLLIQRIDGATGRVRDDLRAALRSLTGQRLAADGTAWRTWWASVAGSFVMPPAPRPSDREAQLAAAAAAAESPPEGGTQFFGVDTFSKRVVFVLDRSGSMRQPANAGTDTTTTKLEIARRHLKQALASLPTDALFDVIVYAGRACAAFPQLAPADEAHRAAALAFIDTAPVGDGTNVHDALRAAFRLADVQAKRTTGAAPPVDTLFFLSDGQPTAGRVQAPELLVREVADWNRTMRIRIHAIGIGKDQSREFLAELAAQHGGTYVAR